MESSNPYQTPQADVSVVNEGQAVAQAPRRVSAGRGFSWISDGISMLMSQNWPWLGVTAIGMLLIVILSSIPFVSILSSLPIAILVGGVMIGCHRQAETGRIRVGDLFEGFSKDPVNLLLVGLFYLLGTIVLLIIMAIIFFVFLGGGQLFEAAMAGETMDPQAFANLWPKIAIAVLIATGLAVPLVMAYWFAPALVGVAGQPALKAMGASFRGCLINIVPFLIYGLVWLVIGVVVMFLFGVIVGGTAALIGGDGVGAITLLFMLLMIPIALFMMGLIWTSMYFGFRDIYLHEPA